MGEKERKAQSQVEFERLGSFNITAHVRYIDGSEETINALKWVHAGDYLALSISTTELNIIPLKNVFKAKITTQQQQHDIKLDG